MKPGTLLTAAAMSRIALQKEPSDAFRKLGVYGSRVWVPGVLDKPYDEQVLELINFDLQKTNQSV